MELDQYKDDLKQMLNQSLPEKTPVDLEKLLKGRSQSALDKIRRNMYLEIVLGVLITLGVGVASAWHTSRVAWLMATLMVVIVVVQAIGFWWQSKKMVNVSPDDDIQQALTRLIAHVERFVHLYLQFNRVVYAVSLLLGAGLGFRLAIYDEQDSILQAFQEVLDQHIILSTVLSIFLIVLGWAIVRWWIRVGYAQYLQTLKECLAELNEK
jgi:FtsH-binding integral membrane protein